MPINYRDYTRMPILRSFKIDSFELHVRGNLAELNTDFRESRRCSTIKESRDVIDV